MAYSVNKARQYGGEISEHTWGIFLIIQETWIPRIVLPPSLQPWFFQTKLKLSLKAAQSERKQDWKQRTDSPRCLALSGIFFINLVCSLTTPSECTQWIMVTPTPHPHPSPSSPVSPHSFLQISPLHPLTIVFALLPIDFTMDCITVGLELSFNTWWAHQWIHRERQ